MLCILSGEEMEVGVNGGRICENEHLPSRMQESLKPYIAPSRQGLSSPSSGTVWWNEISPLWTLHSTAYPHPQHPPYSNPRDSMSSKTLPFPEFRTTVISPFYRKTLRMTEYVEEERSNATLKTELKTKDRVAIIGSGNWYLDRIPG